MQSIDLPMISPSNGDNALIVALDSATQLFLKRILQQAGWQIETCHSHNEFFSLSERSRWLLVIIAYDRDSTPLVEILKNLQPSIISEQTFVIIVADRPSIDEAIICTQNGAMDYLSWPVVPSQFLELAERARRLTALAASKIPDQSTDHLQSDESTKKTSQYDRVLIGSSAAMIELSKQIVRIARSPNLRVFITGETGTGKEVVARLIHEISGRSGPFFAVNCAATVESLLESELFGHEKGAFTGALSMKRGLWEEAANGTLFLDEITETSPTVQAKLLRALQECVIRRVGSNHEIKSTARVIAASNRDVEQTIKVGTFRSDLYYRLGQVLHLPPLRERLEDIPLLVDHFCRRSAENIVITPEAMDALCVYEWPGNVRELESVIQRIITFSGRFVFREDVLRHIEIAQFQQRKINLSLWSALNAFKSEDWPTMREIRNWYVTEAFLYLGKESIVARHLGLDVRTVQAILREEI